MDQITKNKSLVAIIIFLLLTNVAILVFFLFYDNGRKRHGKEDYIEKRLQADVGFSAEQLNIYRNLKKQHEAEVKPLLNNLKIAKQNFYNYLYVQVPDSVKNNAASLIGAKQMELDMHMFEYIKAVRNLGTPEQLPKLDSVYKKLIQWIISSGKSRRDDKKR